MTQLTTPYAFQFDPTGTLAANVYTFTIELQAVNHLPNLCPNGLFYSHDIVVTRTADGAVMTEGTDYHLVGYERWLTEASDGLDAYAGIDIADKTYVGVFNVELRLVGGPQGNPISFIRELVTAINTAATAPSVDFNTQVHNAPTYYTPGPHGHVLREMDELGELAKHFEDVFTALVERIPMKGSGLHFQEQINRLLGLAARLHNRMNHIAADAGNPDRWTDLSNQLATYVNTHDELIPVTAGTTAVLDVLDMTEISSVQGTICCKFSDRVETLAFIASLFNGVDPTMAILSVSNTSGYVQNVEVSISRSGSLATIFVKPDLTGEIQVKYHTLIG